MKRNELHVAILDAIIHGVRRNGQRIFDTSQNTAAGFVPVRTGMLKRSGYTNDLPNGIAIGYAAPYARKVEFGVPAQTFKGVQEIKVRQHQRKTAEGTIINVREHVKRYVDKRLVPIGTNRSGIVQFRVLSSTTGFKGRKYLTRAIFQEIKFLAQDLEFHLKKLGKRKE